MAKSNKVKVKANYDQKGSVKGDAIVLWGNDFVFDGKCYCATVDGDEFASLIDANKVVKAK